MLEAQRYTDYPVEAVELTFYTGRHRRERTLAWPSGQHSGQAASQWAKDRCRTMRGSQHLRTVLPSKAYVWSQARYQGGLDANSLEQSHTLPIFER